MTITQVRIPVQKLEAFVHDMLRAIGMSDEQIRYCGNGIMQSHLRCLPGQGQGVSKLLQYYDRVGSGGIDLEAPFEIVKETAALALVDGHNGLGSMIGQKSMELAVEKAKSGGIGTVIVRNSTHFGSSAVHARIALEHDCIGIAMTNAGPEMAPWGGTTGAVGTNPWSVAAPTGGDFPLVLDIALTTAGKGMMRWLVREGKKMPTDWALTPEGHETDDPAAAMQGALLGIGQHKGYGLAMITDVLTGVIGGGAFGLSPYSDPARQGVAHTFIAVDIGWFMPVDEFKQRMDAFISEVKSSKLRPGFDEILIPGEIEYRREQGYRQNGAEVDESLMVQLEEIASKLGVESPFQR